MSVALPFFFFLLSFASVYRYFHARRDIRETSFATSSYFPKMSICIREKKLCPRGAIMLKIEENP